MNENILKFEMMTNDLPILSVWGRSHDIAVEHHQIGKMKNQTDSSFQSFVCFAIKYDPRDNIAYVYYHGMEDDTETLVVVMPNPYKMTCRKV